MVKSVSLSKKKAVISAVIGIMAVSLFAVSLFYLVPLNSQEGSVVFALGAFDSSAPNSVYCMTFVLNVTFVNGTSVQNPGELNSTDIQQIQFSPADTYFGDVNAPGSWYCIFQFAHDYQIYTGVTGETTLDLGMVDVENSTMSFLSANGLMPPANYTIPTLNYPAQLSSTVYWSSWQAAVKPNILESRWTMNIDQIQSILANATDTVNIAFNLDMTSIAFYQLTTASGTLAGSATEQYSGPCATLQLFHEGDQLVGLQYNSSTIGLTMTES